MCVFRHWCVWYGMVWALSWRLGNKHKVGSVLRSRGSLPHVAAPRCARLAVGSARECDRRKLFTPPECRKFGRVEWGTLYDDYPKLARTYVQRFAMKKSKVNARCQKKTHAKWKRRLERRPSRALASWCLLQPILHAQAAFDHLVLSSAVLTTR